MSRMFPLRELTEELPEELPEGLPEELPQELPKESPEQFPVDFCKNLAEQEAIEGEKLEETKKSLEFPEEALEHVLEFIDSSKDRNAVSQVCKSWFTIEARSRRSVFVGNCYSVSPGITIARFPNIRSLTLKGKPRFADFNLVPADWGANVDCWIRELAMAAASSLEELHVKRMTVSDCSLALLANCFPNFRVLVLTFCDGLSTDGLAMLASNCKNLTELDLQETIVDERAQDWLSCFPETCTSITSLNFTCLSGEVNFDALERLVARCSNLRSLKLNRSVTLQQMQRLLSKAPQLTELGTGSFSQNLSHALFSQLESSFNKISSLKTVSGFWDAEPAYLPLIYPLCSKLLFLNLSYATLDSTDFIKLISHCRVLQRLWVQDFVEDNGLEAAASTCTELEELRVYPTDPEGSGYVTEKGILEISRGCPNLKYLFYFCKQMTNVAVETVARNCRKLTHFRLCILTPRKPDHTTMEPMDEGFGAIVKNCKDLQRLSISGLLTDRVFEYIGKYGKNLQSLSVAFAGDNDKGMQYVLQGCEKLRKLEIRDSPFGDLALLSGLNRYPSMRSLWMSGCNVTIRGCELLATQMPNLNVEVIKENDDSDVKVDKLYVYRSVVGPRQDSPDFVYTL